jgi:hypothetical protein
LCFYGCQVVPVVTRIWNKCLSFFIENTPQMLPSNKGCLPLIL